MNRKHKLSQTEEAPPPKFRPEETQTTQAATELETSLLNVSLDQQKEPLGVFFDLSPYTHVPFVLDMSDDPRHTMNDAFRLANNLPLAHEKTQMLPVWTFQPNELTFEGMKFHVKNIMAANRHGYILRGTFMEQNCIAKILTTTKPSQQLHHVIQEILIQAILLEATDHNRLLPPHCTKIPELKVLGLIDAPNVQRNGRDWEFYGGTETTPSAMIIMQEISYDLYSYTQQIRSDDSELRSNVCASALLQVSNLLMSDAVKPLLFMHADLKMNNITFDMTEEQKPETYLIDFGMASLTYKDTFVGAGMIFRTVRFLHKPFYNPYTDLTYLVWSMWHFEKCTDDLSVDCPKFTALFSRLLRFVLKASGIPFESVRTFDKISMQTFHAMLTAGQPAESLPERFFEYTPSTHLNPVAITIAQVGHYVALYLKSKGSERRGAEASAHLTRLLELP